VAKRFKFRLETVLKIRKRREDAAKREVAVRLGEIARVEGEMAALREQIRVEIDGFRASHATGQINVTQIARHRHWLVHLDRGVLTCENRLRELRERLSGDRAALAEARKRVRVLEKLEERQRERYMKDLNRAEVRELDEISNVLFVRQRAAAAC